MKYYKEILKSLEIAEAKPMSHQKVLKVYCAYTKGKIITNREHSNQNIN